MQRSAARKLKLSPPVVTRAVAELEQRLGLRLLTRTTRFVRVTDVGARFAKTAAASWVRSKRRKPWQPARTPPRGAHSR